MWDVDATEGLEFANAVLAFTYSDKALGPAFNEVDLRINHFVDGSWVALGLCEVGLEGECVLDHDVVANRITVRWGASHPLPWDRYPSLGP